MISSLAIMISALIFAYRSRDGPIFVIRINSLICLVGLSLFLLDLLNIVRPYTFGLLHVCIGPLMAIFAFVYYFLELSIYWLFSFKYFTSAYRKVELEEDNEDEISPESSVRENLESLGDHSNEESRGEEEEDWMCICKC